MLERHAYTTQAFLPLAKAGAEWEKFSGQDQLVDTPGIGGLLVAACLNDQGKRKLFPILPIFFDQCMITGLTTSSCVLSVTDKPDLSTLKVFLAAPNQGISYNAGIWREVFPLT
jgi:hypothetical protein